MLLYKYLDSERIDVLSNKTIRFSQPDSFNDVFECRPFFSDLGCTIEYLKTIGRKELSEYKLSEAEKKNLIDEILSPDIVAERFPKICEFMRYIFANTTGVLSLTENPYSLLMWARYAENHKGYVIGFDSENDFFNRYNTGVNYTLGQLNKVHYTNRRPKVGLSKVELAELYFTKSIDWEYEKEWRFFLNLMDADRIIETEPVPLVWVWSPWFAEKPTGRFDSSVIK